MQYLEAKGSGRSPERHTRFQQGGFGNENAVWTNEAVAFHGYAGWQETTIAVENF